MGSERTEIGQTENLTYIQELQRFPEETVAGFLAPPAESGRALLSSIVRDLPTIALTGGAAVGEGYAFDLINKIFSVNDYRVVSLELLAITVAFIPTTVFARRMTRGIRQSIDHFINPQGNI